MGLVKEPKNVDLVIPPRKIKKKELEELDKAIAHLKAKTTRKRSAARAPKRKRAA